MKAWFENLRRKARTKASNSSEAPSSQGASPSQSLVPPQPEEEERHALSRPRGMGGSKSLPIEGSALLSEGGTPGTTGRRSSAGGGSSQAAAAAPAGAGNRGAQPAAATAGAAAAALSGAAATATAAAGTAGSDMQRGASNGAAATERVDRASVGAAMAAAMAAGPLPNRGGQPAGSGGHRSDGTSAGTSGAGSGSNGRPPGSSHHGIERGRSHAPSEGHVVPRDEDLGSCPPFGTKAVWGLRYTMEDKWAAVPNMVQVPLGFAAPARRGATAAALAGAAAACGCMPGRSSVTSVTAPGTSRRPSGGAGSGTAAGGGSGGSAAPEDAREDEALVAGGAPGSSSSGPTDALHYFGVYDGHGGAEAAKHCAARMHHVLMACIQAALDGDEAAFAQPPPTPPPAPAAEAEQQPGEEGRAVAADKSQSSGTSSSGPPAPPPPAPPPPPLTAPAADGEWLQAVLARAFVTLDHEFAAISEGSYVGTTAVVVLLSSQRIWVAHCGDSRAVLGRGGTAIPLTQDHKASRDDEVARVQAAGGHVWWDRVMGELAVSRAIGDHCLRPYVIPEPEVSMVERHPRDEVLILASDGLWDVLSNQEATDMALHALHAAEAAGLVGVAAARKAASTLTKVALERGTRDNVTVMVVALGAGKVGSASVSGSSARGRLEASSV